MKLIFEALIAVFLVLIALLFWGPFDHVIKYMVVAMSSTVISCAIGEVLFDD